jgi:hypothetical protein
MSKLEDFAAVVRLTIKAALAPEQARSARLDQALTEARAELAGLRERLAIVEARDPVPGPPGPAGADGASFTAGDLECVQAPDDPRLVTLQFRHGEIVTPAGQLHFKGVPQFCGVWATGARYEPGDLVTWQGSQWHCNAATGDRPGGGSAAWTLAVKCGRDGKDAPSGALAGAR